MNRQQRRAMQKQHKWISDPKPAATLEDASTSDLYVTINSCLIELERRGEYIFDFDNPLRRLHRLQIKHGKRYFLAAEEEEDPDATT